jgi:hypothetical protein
LLNGLRNDKLNKTNAAQHAVIVKSSPASTQLNAGLLFAEIKHRQRILNFQIRG